MVFQLSKQKKLINPYKLPPSKAVSYVSDVFIEEESKAAFQKRWDKYGEKLRVKRLNALEKKCRRLIEEVKKKGDDGPFSKSIEIRLVSRKVGYGAFAKKNIPANTPIGLYAGALRYITLKRDKDFKDNSYLFGFEGVREMIYFSVDAEKERNFAAYLNHAQTKSPLCNVYATFHFEKDLPRIMLITSRAIKKGEELRYDYGKGYWSTIGINPT